MNSGLDLDYYDYFPAIELDYLRLLLALFSLTYLPFCRTQLHLMNVSKWKQRMIILNTQTCFVALISSSATSVQEITICFNELLMTDILLVIDLLR